MTISITIKRSFSTWEKPGITIFLLVTFMMSCLIVKGQQDAQFTQFMFNKLTFNPAYSGSNHVPCLSVVHRRQWVGLDGAPVTSAINFNAPLNENRVGMGLTLIHDKIGPTRSTTASMAYAYRIPLKKGTLSLGLQMNLRQYRVTWQNEIALHVGDNLIVEAEKSKILPNAGVGLYYETDNFFIGASAPHIIQGDLSLLRESISRSDLEAIENQHFYGMVGLLFELNREVKFKPAAMVKYVLNAPIDFDLNGTFIFYDKLWAGLSYRWGGSTVRGFGESVDLLLQFQVTHSLRLGIAYDYTLSELQDYSSGTFEFYAHYCLFKGQERVANPRFF